MGSRIMHYCVATLISQQIEIENTDEFILGGITPDVHYYMNVHKDLTHFVDRDENGKGHVNYLRFYEKYRNTIRKPFYLGYLCHLISDDIWSKDTYFKIVEFLSMEERKEKLQISYRDFWRLNGRIITEYNLILREHLIPVELEIEEINFNSLPVLLDWMNKDFSYEQKVAKEPLELFRNDNSQIVDYIDKSVKQSLQFMKDNMLLS
ncbi:zinc dependent phospholipase C family protein [Paenibacillus nasutitermitis]|uniref:Phospholipase C/D domain-containing protein n=1 Tax=Paenibacillus nasutitermitis TaxID=1652958 RepID=A0A917DSC3_9BACL|nr:zinc dependent phospholipase C family protein [Paenibacillus nasutitermitis]GGD62320.1 hypothetical protein GCM10010911_20270 [Paenibacillus nasutitermitis]